MRDNKKKSIVTYIIFIVSALIIGGLSGFLSRDGMKEYANLSRPPLAPPGIVFPIVWSILFILMGIGAAMVYNNSDGPERKTAIGFYTAQLIVNFFWSIIFFSAGQRLFAFIWIMLLLVLVLIMYISFYRVKPAAAYLQIPYILWLCFAAYLNFGVWYLNR